MPEFSECTAFQEDGAALMGRPSRTAVLIVAGIVVVGSVALVAGIHFGSHSAAAGAAASDSPASVSPSVSVSSTLSPFPGDSDSHATLDAGRYVTSDPFPVPVSATVPAGWKSEVGGPYAVFLSTADGDANVGPAVLDLVLSPFVFSNPCQDQPPGPPVGSVDNFVTAVEALHGLTVIRPKTVTVGGLTGKQLTLRAPLHGGRCADGHDLIMALPLGHEFELGPGDTMTLTALDDKGVLLVIDEQTTTEATARDRAQRAAVLKSMSIGEYI